MESMSKEQQGDLLKVVNHPVVLANRCETHYLQKHSVTGRHVEERFWEERSKPSLIS